MKRIDPTVTHEILKKAVRLCWEYKRRAKYAGEIRYSEFLRDYNLYVRLYLEWKKRLEHPFHNKTGAPLKPSTLKGYQSQCRCNERSYRAYKLLIRCAVLNGVLGTPGEALKEKIKESFEQWDKDKPECYYNFKDLNKNMSELIEQSNKKKNSLSDVEEVKYMMKVLELMGKNIERMKTRIDLEIKLGYLPRPSEVNGNDQRKRKIEALGLNIIDGGKPEDPPVAPPPQA